MNDNSVDGFELYRRQRQRHRRLASVEKRSVSGVTNALRELEAVEERENRDRHLQREVSDFFETARLTAADIVQKVAESAKEQTDERLGSEMHDFLLDSLTRMQDLIHEVLDNSCDSKAEEVIEPRMHNISGRALDGFRQAGIGGDNHLGQDPMKTDLADVRREFRARMPKHDEVVRVADEDPSVDENLDALAHPSLETGEETGTSQVIVEDAGELVGDFVSSEDRSPAPSVTPAPVTAETDVDLADVDPDMQRFMRALESLVDQGNISEDEAAAVMQVRQGSRS
ncbi:MAG: hypothetical protein VYE77_09420 [Planctomycetota bacterium]|nr:hypothetical protein [Planctomycetota bacterium]